MIGASPDMLEDNLREPYTAWKTSPGPVANAAMLKALQPTIDGAIQTHVGKSNPLLVSRARVLALQGMSGYDPKRGRLQSFMYNHLLALKRANQQQTQILKVPERIALDRGHLHRAEAELQATLGREPTDDEISDHTGFSGSRIAKVRSFQSGVSEGRLEDLESAGTGYTSSGSRLPVAPERTKWADIIYDELPVTHKKVMELGWGLNGRKPMRGQEIAQKLKLSPGRISQIAKDIQTKLDEEHELSPF